VRLARESLRNDVPATWIVRIPLSSMPGQHSAGVATLVFATLDAAAMPWLDAARACARTAAPFAVVARLYAPSDAGRRLLVSADDVRATLGDASLDSAAITFARARLAAGTSGSLLMAVPGARDASLVVQIERPDPFPVLVFGNGHVARALVQVLGVLPLQVRWIDAREDGFPARVPDNVAIVRTERPDAELRAAAPGSFVLVMTHSHALDFALIEAALMRSDWRYVGMIGSKAKRAELERRLAERGIAAARMAAVACPIGARLPGLGGKSPGVIALATAAELLAVKADAQHRPRETGGGGSQRRA
jgi:xanthine dehydrogenase accessory factor